MTREIQLVRDIALAADGFYERSRQLGQKAAGYFGSEQAGRSQIKQLESIANSAIKVSDVFDFIKKQIGKDKGKDTARQSWAREDFGLALLSFLENDLKATSGSINPLTPRESQRIHIDLIRAFVTQLAAEFEFSAMPSASHGETAAARSRA